MAMLEEAHAALDETQAAIRALDEGISQEALDALARATGKLELLVAHGRAETLPEDGKVQEARRLLSGLASELVINVTNLPLATSPDAIKAISPLIDDGKTEEHELFRDRIKDLESKMRDEKEATGAFARLSKSIGDLQQSILQ